jgi:hypothetical protein
MLRRDAAEGSVTANGLGGRGEGVRVEGAGGVAVRSAA